MGVGLFSKGTVAEVFIHLAGFKICCKQQIQPAIIIDVGKVSGKCKVCIAYQICKACLGIQAFKPDPLRAAYVAPQVGRLFAAQSGAAPGAGLLRLALLELNPAAVLARSGAITGNAIFRSYQLWLDYFSCFCLVVGNRQTSEVPT